MVEKKKCNIFQEVDSFDVLDVTVEHTATKEIRKKIDSDGNVVEVWTVETIQTILKPKEAPKESTGIKATLIVGGGLFVTLIGVLSDLPGAIEFVGKALHLT